MVARVRHHNETFEKYRKNLKREQEELEFRLSTAYRDGGRLNLFRRIFKFGMNAFHQKRHMLPKRRALGIRKRGADGTRRGGIDMTKASPNSIRWSR